MTVTFNPAKFEEVIEMGAKAHEAMQAAKAAWKKGNFALAMASHLDAEIYRHFLRYDMPKACDLPARYSSEDFDRLTGQRDAWEELDHRQRFAR